nr:ABC transporter F family member 4 [Ipomoea batatas]GME14465.1 ABC transporter F family member 4 [Ipomoea batatas]
MSNIDGLINFNDGAAVGGRSLFIPWGTSKQAAIKMRLLEVRFRVDDEEERRKLGVVRIRLVVTREELRQILNGEESGPGYSSSEELLAAIKLGSRRSSRKRMDDQRFPSSDGDMKSRKWRPALESIPEF